MLHHVPLQGLIVQLILDQSFFAFRHHTRAKICLEVLNPRENGKIQKCLDREREAIDRTANRVN